MKMGKKVAKRIISASMVMCMAVSMAVFPSYAAMDDDINSKGNIVLDNGEVTLYGSDMDYLADELDSLESELPDTSKQPYYGTARKSGLNSKGIIDYASGTVLIDSADYIYLANEIDSLESGYKANTVDALNAMGTFFLADGSISHEVNDGGIPREEATRLSFDTIISGILQSQSVNHLAAQNIIPSIEDNLSKGTAAWVDGKLIIGNGADNNAYYNQGFLDGQLSLYDKVSISYVYHEHMGNNFSGGGCYTLPVYHSHTASCPSHQEDTGNKVPCQCGSTSWTTGDEGYGDYKCGSCGHEPHGGPCDHSVKETVTVWDCGMGGRIIYYNVGCGKTTSTIESATIVFDN